MTNTCGNSWQIIFSPQDVVDEAFDTFAENFFDVVSIDYTDDEKEQYIGYTHKQPDEEEMKTIAKNLGIELPDYECIFIPATNWLTKNVIKFPPIETEDFYIYGSHEEKAPQTSKLAIKIYAATAFGDRKSIV